MKHNLIQQKTFEFAISIVKLSRQIKQKQDYVLSNQLLRSGTSIGANVEEAIGGSSKKDFLSKILIANKEARETNYWLRIIQAEDPSLNLKSYLKESAEIINILSKIIITTRKNILSNVNFNL